MKTFYLFQKLNIYERLTLKALSTSWLESEVIRETIITNLSIVSVSVTSLGANDTLMTIPFVTWIACYNNKYKKDK